MSTYESTRRQIPEIQHRYSHRHENLKSRGNVVLGRKVSVVGKDLWKKGLQFLHLPRRSAGRHTRGSPETQNTQRHVLI